MPGSNRPTSAPYNSCQALSWGRDCSVRLRTLVTLVRNVFSSAKEFDEFAYALGAHTVAQDPDHKIIALLANAAEPQLRCTAANLKKAHQIAAKVLNRRVEVVEDNYCPPDSIYAMDAAAMRFPPLSEWKRTEPYLPENIPVPALKYSFDWTIKPNRDYSRNA